MSWIQFSILFALLCYIMKWIYTQAKDAKIERELATLDRKEMLQSIKNIETETKQLHKVLNPIEKRHFR